MCFQNWTASDWITWSLVLLNGIFVITIICDFIYRRTEVKKLIKERKKSGEVYDEDELKDEIEPKQLFAWIMVL